MNKTKLSWTVTMIEKMYEKNNTLSFEHPIQRKSEIWSEQQKSLLIHSMLSNYPVPSIYVLRQNSEQTDSKGKPVFSHFVLDGKQRLTSVLSYLQGEFELSENIQPITIEDEEYELAGKYFVDLDKAVQYEIKHYKFDIIAFEECSDREVEEIFLRLNFGSALTKAQIAKAKAGVEVAGLLNELLSSRFIMEICFFTKAQIAKSEDQRCLLQAMMLFDRNYVPGFTFKDFSEQAITEYSESLNGNYTEKQTDVIRSAVEYLSNAFQEKNKNLKKISVPMLLYVADYAQDKEVFPRKFGKWYDYFTTKDKNYEDFKYFGNSGSTKLDKINGRLTVMMRSFCQFCDQDLPEELADIIENTDKLLEERDALMSVAETSEADGAEESAAPVQTEKDSSITDEKTALTDDDLKEMVIFVENDDTPDTDMTGQENAETPEETGIQESDIECAEEETESHDSGTNHEEQDLDNSSNAE